MTLPKEQVTTSFGNEYTNRRQGDLGGWQKMRSTHVEGRRAGLRRLSETTAHSSLRRQRPSVWKESGTWRQQDGLQKPGMYEHWAGRSAHLGVSPVLHQPPASPQHKEVAGSHGRSRCPHPALPQSQVCNPVAAETRLLKRKGGNRENHRSSHLQTRAAATG